jgi:hypothetical protein
MALRRLADGKIEYEDFNKKTWMKISISVNFP